MRTSNKLYKEKKLNEIKDFLANEGYEVLSNKYINRNEKLKIKCPNGHVYYTSWAVVHRGSRCKQCSIENFRQHNPKYKGKSREQYREEMKLKLIEEIESEGYSIDNDVEYVNNRTKFKVTCPNGHSYSTHRNNWINGRRCRECFRDSMFLSFDEVSSRLENEGCTLLEWNGTEKKMLYICECGNKHRTRYSDWKNGVRCHLCGARKAKETRRKKMLKKMEEHFQEV